MGVLQRASRLLIDLATRALTSQQSHGASTDSRQRPGSSDARRGPTLTQTAHTPASIGGKVGEYRGALPPLEYAPADDGDADPGEIVWAWVPYEDDPSQGKDRPILILARLGSDLLAVQLTTRDRASGGYFVDHHGREWYDIGSGAWDRQGRPSEVRLDRLLLVPSGQVRREGAALQRDRYEAVVQQIRQAHQ